MELGCTREPFFDSVIMDPFGTNGAGLIPKIDIKDIKTIVNGDSLSAENAILCFTGRNILGYEQQFEPLDSDLYKQISTNQPKVFFPLQLFDDINLLHFSPYNSLVEVVSDVVPKLVEAGYLVIIKPHPSSRDLPLWYEKFFLSKEPKVDNVQVEANIKLEELFKKYIKNLK